MNPMEFFHLTTSILFQESVKCLDIEANGVL